MDTRDFLELIWDGLQGHVVMVTRDERGGLTDESWRPNTERGLSYLTKFAELRNEEDVYLGVTAFSDERRSKDDALAVTRVVWADADTCAPQNFRTAPSVVVETSPGRWHCWWVLEEPVLASEAEQVARAIAYAHQGDGCDLGWTRTKLLRVPGTTNAKDAENPHPVQVTNATGEVYTLDALRALYPAEAAPKQAPVTARKADGAVRPVPEHLRDLYETEAPAGKRSDAIMRLSCDLLREGWNPEDVHATMTESANVQAKGWNADNLWRDVLKAVSKVGSVAVSDEQFWRSRPELRNLHNLGLANDVSPWALLALALPRALEQVPWWVKLCTYKIGMDAPLNLGVVVHGATGSGKSSVVQGLNWLIPNAVPVNAGPLRSGEGIITALASFKIDKETKNKVMTWRNPQHAVAVTYDEVSHLGTVANRNGDSTFTYLLTALTGGGLGGFKVEEKEPQIPANEYRASVAIFGQPGHCKSILNPDAVTAGLPGRFAWFSPAYTIEQLDTPPEAEPYQRDLVELDWAKHDMIRALPVMDDAFRVETRARALGELSAIDGHRAMVRAKVAVALMVLNGRTELIESDWELSAVVQRHSDRVRDAAITAEAGVAMEENKKSGYAKAAQEAAVADHHANRLADRIRNRRDHYLTCKTLKSLNLGRDRKYRGPALELLIGDGGELGKWASEMLSKAVAA